MAVEADEVLGISPFEIPDARLVAELCAAGARGVLDLGHGDRRARRALDQTARWTSGPFGVRMGESCDFPIDELPDAVALVVVPAGRAVPTGRRTLVEVTDLEQARRAIAAGAAGLIARGRRSRRPGRRADHVRAAAAAAGRAGRADLGVRRHRTAHRRRRDRRRRRRRRAGHAAGAAAVRVALPRGGRRAVR